MKPSKIVYLCVAFMLLNFTLESCQREEPSLQISTWLTSTQRQSKTVSFNSDNLIDEFEKVDADLFVDTSFDLDANIKEKYKELNLSDKDRLTLDKKYKNERLAVMQNRSQDPACALYLQQQRFNELKSMLLIGDKIKKSHEIKIAAQKKILQNQAAIIEKYRKDEEMNNSTMTALSIGSIIAAGAYYFYQK